MASNNSYVNHNSVDYQLGGEDQPNFSESRIEIGHLRNSNENLQIRSPISSSNPIKNRMPTGLIISYLVIICISLLVAVLVVAGRPRAVEVKSGFMDKNICRDEICQAYVHDLSSVMNAGVDPCEDFYEYVCGNWSQVHPLGDQIVTSPAYIANSQINERLTEYLTNIRYSKVAIENKDPHEIAAFLYNSCVEEMALTTFYSMGFRIMNQSALAILIMPSPLEYEYYGSCVSKYHATAFENLLTVTQQKTFSEDQVSDLQTLVTQFNGWPLVGDVFNDTIVDIISYNFFARWEFNLNVIFDINVIPNPFKPENSVLMISRSSFFAQPNINSETTNFYASPDANKLKDIISKLFPEGSTKNPNMIKDLNDVIDLDTKLSELKNRATSNYYTNYKNVVVDAILEMKKSLKQLNELIPFSGDADPNNLNWVPIIKYLLNNSEKVDENYEIGVEISTVNATLNVLYDTDIKIVKNWFVYKVLVTLGPRFSAKLREVFLGKPLAPQYCANEVNSLMHYAIADIYDANFWSKKSKGNRNKILDLAKEVKFAATNALASSSWLDDKSKQNLIEKLGNITVKVGFPDWIKDRTKLTAYYDPKYSENSATDNSSYLDVARWILKLNWPRNVQQLMDKFIRKDFWLEKNLVQFNAWYYPLDNSITFPIGYLDYPMFAGSSQPKYLVFGMLGSVIGHEVFHSLDPFGIFFDGHGQLNTDVFDPNIENRYSEKLQCLMDQYKETTKRKVPTITEDFADNAAVQFIFNAYAESQSDVFHNDYLPNTDEPKAKYFYISYASNWCEETTKQYDNLTLNDVHSHGRDRVMIPLQNSKSFSNVFKCPVGSIMNPVKKCEVF